MKTRDKNLLRMTGRLDTKRTRKSPGKGNRRSEFWKTETKINSDRKEKVKPLLNDEPVTTNFRSDDDH